MFPKKFQLFFTNYFNNNYSKKLSVGGMPFILFKKNTKSKGFGSSTWRQMYYYFKQRPQEFFKHYHKRSNVETTFAMIK